MKTKSSKNHTPMDLEGADNLDLPVPTIDMSTAPKYTFEEMFMICQKLLPYTNPLRNKDEIIGGEVFKLLD